MKAADYSSLKSTALVIQLVSQMIGKFKLAKMAAQPEWQQVTLPLTARGFTTGLVPCGTKGCTITIDLFNSTVVAQTTDGKQSFFSLEESRSIAEYFTAFKQMMKEVDVFVEINPLPQEMSITTPFTEDIEPRYYRPDEARECFDMFAFAHGVILDFVSSFRCKTALPELFWGTFDVTGILYSGKAAPYPGDDLIAKVAFDEELIEYGFWLGDEAWDKASFFVLPYPFIEEDLSGTLSEDSQGFYSKDQGEYFLILEDVLASKDPYAEIMNFFRETFAVLTARGHWEQKDWFTTPLLVECDRLRER